MMTPCLLSLLLGCAAAGRAKFEVYVDPVGGDDSLLGLEQSSALRSVHVAAAVVRRLVQEDPSAEVVVQLLPGAHTVGDNPLVLGPEDGGSAQGSVVWRSFDPHTPASLTAGVRVTGWKPHSEVKGAYSAPLPANITPGSQLRHLWVDGKRASRPVGYPVCAGGPCPVPATDGPSRPKFNLTMTRNTSMYPEGSQYDFSATGLDPSSWKNPADVEFVFTGCASFNCWVEPRCSVSNVSGELVSLSQGDNSSCFWRLYYFGIGWGGSPDGGGLWRKFPTAIENLASNWTQPGEFYYDRAAGSIGYIPRSGENIATLEATATTATAQYILVVNSTRNLVWEGVRFEYATWLGANGPQGFVDTQSAFLYRGNNNPAAGGEAPVNIHVQASTNITFASCAFEHLGGVPAPGNISLCRSVCVSLSLSLSLSNFGVHSNRPE